MRKVKITVIMLTFTVFVLAITLVIFVKYPKHIHKINIDAAVAPTCTDAGLTEGKHCSVCGITFLKQETIIAKGHKWSDNVCSVCGYSGGEIKYTLNSDGKSYCVSKVFHGVNVVIPPKHEGLPITRIGSDAFFGLTSLKSVTIPNSITHIDSGAFTGCTNLVDITIPSSVTKIGNATFSFCHNLENITVEKGNEYYHSAGNCLIKTASKTLIAGCQNSVIPVDGSVKDIDGSAFVNCYNITKITIPNGVTIIRDCTFLGCHNLKSITIPDSVTSIGNYALGYCFNLETIIFKGTEEQWNAITKETGWDFRSGENISASNYNLLFEK